MERLSGTVKWFADEKGFGFIRCDDGRELFVHYSQIRGSGHRRIDEGQAVTFSIGKDGRNRDMAADVAT